MNLDAIRERYRKALDAKPSKGDYTPEGIDAIVDSVCDVPELLAEVDRLREQVLPDPKGGCVCRSHSEDRGGGYFELMVEYEPACPEHSEHVYNPRSGVWEFDATARAEAAEQAVQRVRDLAAHWEWFGSLWSTAARRILRALDGGAS